MISMQEPMESQHYSPEQFRIAATYATLDFVQVDPQAPPALAGISGDADWSILFFSGGASMDLKRTDLRRVKPYAERFEVKIGTIKAIDF
jgi:hypothetical protein